MGRVGVLGVRVAAGPDFMEQESAGCVYGAVQVVAEATVFFASGRHQGAQLRFEDRFLAFASAQKNDQCDGFLGKLWISVNVTCVKPFSCPRAWRLLFWLCVWP